MTDRGPTVINTGRSSTVGWAVAVILALVVIGGLLMFTGVININGGGGTDVNVNVPAVETPSTDKPATRHPGDNRHPGYRNGYACNRHDHYPVDVKSDWAHALEAEATAPLRRRCHVDVGVSETRQPLGQEVEEALVVDFAHDLGIVLAPVTCHQSTTVMPTVSSDFVSISTLQSRPLNSSGRKQIGDDGRIVQRPAIACRISRCRSARRIPASPPWQRRPASRSP